MSFFQNLFPEEFRETLATTDIQFSQTFPIPPNINQWDYQLAWKTGPYDFSTYGSILTINFAFQNNPQAWSALDVDVVGLDVAATTPQEVVTALNNNTTFSDYFTANLFQNPKPPMSPLQVLIKAKSPRPTDCRIYISNDGAETALGFNLKASIRQLPTFFKKDTIENRFNPPNSFARPGLGMLILLDPLNPIDAQLITDAGLDPTNELADWQIISGRNSQFNFSKITVDGDDRITQIIDYPAGSGIGAFARKTQYVYTGANKNPDQITEVPYTLQSSDLVTPP
jgi:hypothetical protein